MLRYILQKLFNKGTDAIGNARRKNRNEKNGAEVVRLADLYPEIAAMHRANGTDHAANPALMAAATGTAAATALASTSEAEAISKSIAPGYEDSALARPSYDRIPEEPKDSDRRTGLKATAIFITVMGILANLPFLFEVFLRLIRHARSFDSNNTVVAYSSYVYDIGVLRGILVLSLLSVAAYLILLFTKRINFTFFYPALTFILSILFYLVLNRYAAFYGGDRFAPDRTRNVPSNIQSARNFHDDLFHKAEAMEPLGRASSRNHRGVLLRLRIRADQRLDRRADHPVLQLRRLPAPRAAVFLRL